MPENQDPQSNEGDGTVGSSNVQKQRDHIKKLEQELADAKADAATAKAEAAAAAADREQLATFQRAAAFDRLNIPPTGTGKLFRDTYQGELTDEAIVAKATEYGVVQPPTNATAPTIPGVDMDAMSRMQAALAGSATGPTTNDAMALLQGAQSTQELDAVLEKLGILGSPQ